MLVPREQLSNYNIPQDYFFESRVGSDLKARDYFFNSNPALLKEGIYCAVGDDENGWELELFNGANWVIVNPNPNYLMTITNAGLAAVNSILSGGIRLYFSGIKMISKTIVNNPIVPIVNWTDNEFLGAGGGEFIFTCGTNGSPNLDIKDILSWRFNDSSGSLQYIVTLPPEGVGAFSDFADEKWEIGAVGLYVKSPDNGFEDILFAVARFPSLVTKIATTNEGPGNTIKFYLNTVLSNLGYISDLSILPCEEHSIPEVPNESLLTYPTDIRQRNFNCYLVDNLYGTGTPAIAVPRLNLDHTITTKPSWAYIQPTDNFMTVDPSLFANDVADYMFVYWNSEHGKYERAVGLIEGDPTVPVEEREAKLPMGVRVGNTIVFSGELLNDSTNYMYTIELNNGGVNYQFGDELLLIFKNGTSTDTNQTAGDLSRSDIVFKIVVEEVNEAGSITRFTFKGPTAGDTPLPTASATYAAVYSPYSQLPRYGMGAKFVVSMSDLVKTEWSFTPDDVNKPVYCGAGDKAGLPVFTFTDGFVGWCTGLNSIKLALDLRNEASEERFGTTRYATDLQVKESYSNAGVANQRAVTPETLKANYLQTTLPENGNQPGSSQGNPNIISSYNYFDKIILGKGTKSPYDSSVENPMVTDPSISFYGLAYSAWYQDIAELYEADKNYEPGTLITMGKGLKEISIATEEADGVISDKPGFILGKKRTDTHLPVALVGRTPVLFDGHCIPKFGDKIYLSTFIPGRASTIKHGKCIGKIIDRACRGSKLECVVKLSFKD